MAFRLMENVHLSQKAFPSLSSNFPLVDEVSFSHLLEVKGIKKSDFSIYLTSGMEGMLKLEMSLQITDCS